MSQQLAYKAIEIHSNKAKPLVASEPFKKPGKNEVLVRMEYSPINPVDLAVFAGWYPTSGEYPITGGSEGSGIIAEVGQELKIPHKVGDRVAIVHDGAWANYITVQSDCVFTIPQNVSLEQAAMHCINPWTVELMVSEIKKGNHKACVHTVGASSLGKKLISRLKVEGIKLINLVRREGLLKEIAPLKPDVVINTENPGWETQFKKVCGEIKPTICFDSVAGEFTGKIFDLMPPGINLQMYGNLASDEVTHISVANLLFEGKVLSGLWLVQWMQKMTPEEKQKVAQHVFPQLNDVMKSDITKIFRLEEFEQAIEFYKANTQGKTLLKLN